jgi:hypothetical protein
MTRVFHLSMKKVYAKMQLKVMSIKSFKHFLQVLHVIPWSYVLNYNIINVALSKTKSH